MGAKIFGRAVARRYRFAIDGFETGVRIDGFNQRLIAEVHGGDVFAGLGIQDVKIPVFPAVTTRA